MDRTDLLNNALMVGWLLSAVVVHGLFWSGGEARDLVYAGVIWLIVDRMLWREMDKR